VHEVLLCLGVARHALVLLEEGSRNVPALHGPSVNEIAKHGLGGK